MDTNETTLYTAILITGIVIGAVISYFAITIIRSHRKHFKMMRSHFLSEMERLEKERSRIARDLHDELGPILAVTSIHLNAMEGGKKEDQHHLEIANSNISFLTERFSGIAKNLTSRLLERKGLKTALEDFFEQYREVSRIKMNLLYKIQNDISMSIGIHIFRMVQEMVYNAVKHSNASELSVLLMERRKKLYILYKDNGKGLRAETHDKETGMGLESLKSRATLLGGKMGFKSSEEEGTEYFFEIPLIKNNEETYPDSNSR